MSKPVVKLSYPHDLERVARRELSKTTTTTTTPSPLVSLESVAQSLENIVLVPSSDSNEAYDDNNNNISTSNVINGNSSKNNNNVLPEVETWTITPTAVDVKTTPEPEKLLYASDMQCQVIHNAGFLSVSNHLPKWILSCYDIPKSFLDDITFSETKDCSIVEGVKECSIALNV